MGAAVYLSINLSINPYTYAHNSIRDTYDTQTARCLLGAGAIHIDTYACMHIDTYICTCMQVLKGTATSVWVENTPRVQALTRLECRC